MPFHVVAIASVLMCFLLTGVILLFLQRPLKVQGAVFDEEWKLCDFCMRDRTYQRLENVETGELHPSCLRCMSKRKYDETKYEPHYVRSELPFQWADAPPRMHT